MMQYTFIFIYSFKRKQNFPIHDYTEFIITYPFNIHRYILILYYNYLILFK